MARRRKNPVSLSAQERLELEGLIASGHAPARQLSHARVLLSRPTRVRMRPAKPGLT
jgi:hypothetical protein